MNEIDIDILITAFNFPYDEFTYYFLWDKNEEKVVKISLWDYNDFEEGVLKNEEVSNAIKNQHNNYVDVPRFTIEERINMMKAFAATLHDGALRKIIEERIEDIIESTVKYNVKHLRSGFLRGIDMKSLTNNLSDEIVESWRDFYHDKTKQKISELLASF